MRTRSLALILPLALTACSLVVDSAPVEREVEQFHCALDEGRFEQICEATGDELKIPGNRPLLTLLEEVHRKLGKVKSAEKIHTDRNSVAKGTFIDLTYQTTFAEGPAVEQFSYRITDGKPTLVGYNVRSDRLTQYR